MRVIWSLTLLLLSLSGCSSTSDAPDAMPCFFEIQWGPARNPDFTAFGESDRAELTKGFQGFLYVLSTIRMVTDGDPIGAPLAFQIEVEGQEVYTSRQPVTDKVSAPDANGVRYFDEARPRFDDIPLAELVGKKTTVTTTLVVDGCRAVHKVDIVLVDEKTCIEETDGSFSCT